MSLILPPLPLAATVVILADHDANGAGEHAARAAAARWLAEGRRVRIALPPEPGTDFADLLLGSSASRAGGHAMPPLDETGPAAIRRIIEGAAEVTPEPWPEPDRSLLDPQVSPAPPFFDVLPAGWSEWAHVAAEGASCSVDYVALPLLAAAGSLIGNARWGQPWAGWCEPPALFAGLIGRPSSGKSPGLDTVTGLLARQEMTLNEDWDERRRAHIRDSTAAKERRSRWEGEVKAAVEKGQAAAGHAGGRGRSGAAAKTTVAQHGTDGRESGAAGARQPSRPAARARRAGGLDRRDGPLFARRWQRSGVLAASLWRADLGAGSRQGCRPGNDNPAPVVGSCRRDAAGPRGEPASCRGR